MTTTVLLAGATGLFNSRNTHALFEDIGVSVQLLARCAALDANVRASSRSLPTP